MPVYVHDITFGPENYQRGHWLDRLQALDDDITDMETLLDKTTGDSKDAVKLDPAVVEQAMRAVLEKPKPGEPPPLADFHLPPPPFRRGQLLTILAHAPQAAAVRLRYRHVNQAELWQTLEMQRRRGDYWVEMPAAYTDSPFPLQYYFQIRDAAGATRLQPGLQPGWFSQPYFVVRQA